MSACLSNNFGFSSCSTGVNVSLTYVSPVSLNNFSAVSQSLSNVKTYCISCQTKVLFKPIILIFSSKIILLGNLTTRPVLASEESQLRSSNNSIFVKFISITSPITSSISTRCPIRKYLRNLMTKQPMIIVVKHSTTKKIRPPSSNAISTNALNACIQINKIATTVTLKKIVFNVLSNVNRLERLPTLYFTILRSNIWVNVANIIIIVDKAILSKYSPGVAEVDKRLSINLSI